MTLHVRVAGGWTGRLYSICQEDAERLERQHSRHRIAQRQLSNKLSPFQSMPMQLQLEKSVDESGQDNPAYQQESASLPPTTNSEIAISIVSTVEPPSRAPNKDISPLEVPAATFFSPRWRERLKNDFQFIQSIQMPIMLDGPYSGSAMRAWNCRHALFIAGGIGVTPFASLLQSLVSRYQSSMTACPHCHQSCCTSVPASLGKLRHVS